MRSAKSLQACPTLYDPMDCSPPGSSVHGILEWVAIFVRRAPVHGILQERILEWTAIFLQTRD